jgi:hypothetical protein
VSFRKPETTQKKIPGLPSVSISYTYPKYLKRTEGEHISHSDRFIGYP